MDLKGKVAIVTGASRGVGKAMAMGLADKGAMVIIAARTEVETPPMPGSIELTARQIREAGGQAHPLRCDVTDEAEVNDMVSRAIGLFGRVDVLVNNSGIAFPAHAWEMSLKRWELVIRVNLTGAFLCARAVLPGMMERRAGSIINISSIQATQEGSVRTGIAYGVSKAALERFTVGLAEEVRPFNVAVNCLKPRGAVSTEGMAYLHTTADKTRWDTPDMMVRACAFLASQGDGGVTGLVATDEEICGRYLGEG
jgi:NAD(P)-dependent dehydrogenase (short-subunit alcohol dehydrogenase family)